MKTLFDETIGSHYLLQLKEEEGIVYHKFTKISEGLAGSQLGRGTKNYQTLQSATQHTVSVSVGYRNNVILLAGKSYLMQRAILA